MDRQTDRDRERKGNREIDTQTEKGRHKEMI